MQGYADREGSLIFPQWDMVGVIASLAWYRSSLKFIGHRHPLRVSP